MTDGLPSDQARAAEDWLAAEMGRIWLLAERELRHLQRVGLRPAPDDPALRELEGLLAARRAARHGGQLLAHDEEEFQRALRHSEARVVPLRRTAPIGRLAESLHLRPMELETLLCVTAPHIDAPLADLLAVLRGPTVRHGLDLAMVAQLHRLGRRERIALLDVIDPERPLLAWRLIQIAPPDSAAAYDSVNYRAIQPTFDLLSLLCGRGERAPDLVQQTRLYLARDTLDDLVLEPPLRAQLALLCDAARGTREDLSQLPWLFFYGPRGVGKTEVAARVAAAAGRALLVFAPESVPEGALAETLRRVQREALLRGALLYLGPLTRPALAEPVNELSKLLQGHKSPVLLGVESMQPPQLKLKRPYQEFALSPPGEALRLSLWERAVPVGLRGDDLDLAGLARGFHLTPGEIREITGEARAVVALSPGSRLAHVALREGIERRLRSELGEVARRLTISASFRDLVLPHEDMDRIQEFISRSAFASLVYEEWGLGERVGYGKGLIALFSGPPGTGKTMLAGLIAKALDLDIYQVDLSQVVSKWVGETEKQLGRLFDQAERSHAVLLFDEADALLARRTEVKSSNDRYGNLAVNYLLQRLEQYSGVVVLTTNKEASLDEALRRRLSLHLHLQVPDVDERERLWWSMLPVTLPVARDLDLRQIAEEYELTGGYIKNITVRAAFLVASEGGEINLGILRRAVALEMEDLGRLVTRTARGQEEEPEGFEAPPPKGAADAAGRAAPGCDGPQEDV